MSDVYYFGCIGESGHFLFTPNMRTARNAGPFTPASLDTPFCPGMTPDSRGYAPREQPEGVARLAHHEGWTVLSFWDRSVDDRRGSHSTFAIDCLCTFDEAVAYAREKFPRVWARYKFTVREGT